MCEKRVGPSPKDILTNLAEDMPLGKKLGLILRNNLSKLRHGAICCGHPGEPGC